MKKTIYSLLSPQSLVKLGRVAVMDNVVEEEIVIVGAGIAGLTTALGLHRMGLRCLVLESWDSLRVSGFAFTTWTNAWKALDALDIGDSLRRQHDLLQGVMACSTTSGSTTSQISFTAKGKLGKHEVRCVKRQALLDALAQDLPQGTIRFCSKVVLIEDAGLFKLLHLADGTTLKTKVLVGCDGVNSVVAKWLGLPKAAFTGRSAIRGITKFPDGHTFASTFFQFFGDGYRSGFLPCDRNTFYWFFTFTSSAAQDKDLEEDPSKMKHFVLNKLGKVATEFLDIVENTDIDSIILSPLRFRWPTNMLFGSICKGNVCVAGDALHPMTPDIGQGGCAALEDGIVLARCLSQAFLATPGKLTTEEEEEQTRIKKGLNKFAQQRKWRSFQLISTAYLAGRIQQSDGKVMMFLRDKVLSSYLARLLLTSADYDCGNLSIS